MIGSILKGARFQSKLLLPRFSILSIKPKLQPSSHSSYLANSTFSFAKISKKEKDKQKLDEEKKKAK